MKILMLGGTRFLGRATVEVALERGHEVTLFNRGQSNPDLFSDLEQLHGDRDGGLDVLKGRTWDAVIDPSGYVPRLVKNSAEMLADTVEHYTFISSISVYRNFSQINMDESGPLGEIDDPTIEEINGETYGPLKVLCEQAAEAAMPGRVLHVRAGLIVGPHDLSDRFTYWPWRVAQGGDLIAPDSPDCQVQFVDVRDLAAWNIHMIETNGTGYFNATGPNPNLTIGEVIDTCKSVSGSDANPVWIPEAFLLENEIAPWMGLPLWLPDGDENYRGMNRINCQKAFDAGLKFRPLEETVSDTLEWSKSRADDYEMRAGLKAEKEAEVLKLWAEKTAN